MAQRADLGASLLLSLQKPDSTMVPIFIDKEPGSPSSQASTLLAQNYLHQQQQGLLPVQFLPLSNQPFVAYAQQNSYLSYNGANASSTVPVMTPLMVSTTEADASSGILRYRISDGSTQNGQTPVTTTTSSTQAIPILSPISAIPPQHPSIIIQQQQQLQQQQASQTPLHYQQMILQPSPQTHQIVPTNNALALSPIQNASSGQRSKSPPPPRLRRPSGGAHKRASALSSEICKALLGKSSEFGSEVQQLVLEGNTPGERRNWFHTHICRPGLYMITFPTPLSRRSIVAFEKTDREVKYHATTWSKRAGQGLQAPYVYMRCCPASSTCLARKYVVLFPSSSDSNLSYKAMSVYIPGPEAHECNKNPYGRASQNVEGTSSSSSVRWLH